MRVSLASGQPVWHLMRMLGLDGLDMGAEVYSALEDAAIARQAGQASNGRSDSESRAVQMARRLVGAAR